MKKTHTVPLLDQTDVPQGEYSYSINELKELMHDRQPESLEKYSDMIGKLRSSKLNGISSGTVLQSRAYFGMNKVEPPPPTPFWRLILDALSDLTMIILMIAALFSIILGTTVQKPEDMEWIDGVAILVAVVVVVSIASINDYSKEKQFRKLNAAKNDKLIKVIREGEQKQVSIYDVVVGDVVILETGDQIPADGIILQSADMKVDESGMTGESDEIKKGEHCPFLIGSCLVTSGSGRQLVIAVGPNSISGEIQMTLQEDEEETPLQGKLDDLAKQISVMGVVAAILVFVVLIIKFFVAGKHKDGKNFVEWVKYFMLSVSLLVCAVPEGLPLAVTISLAYSMKQMIKDQCLVRKLESCETMGSVSQICTDKTGTLTLNQMRVKRAQFGTKIFEMDQMGQVAQAQKTAFGLISSICSTAQLETSVKTGLKNQTSTQTQVVGNKTEGALLILGSEFGADYKKMRDNLVVGDNAEGCIVSKIDFSSERKRMSTILDAQAYRVKFPQLQCKSRYIALCKGASEIMLQRCSKMISDDGQIVEMGMQAQILNNIEQFAKGSLRTLILAYKETDELPDNREDVEHDLVFVCMVGIMDPLREGVPSAIDKCTHAGITVRMVTGDNLLTAIAISKDAHIIPVNASDADLKKMAITGPEFAKMSDEDASRLIPTLRCMARSSPKDKYRLVSLLKQQNLVVAATGDGSNDAPQLKVANVGLAMGIAGTEVAKEASDIIIMNDNFCTIVRAIEWGRTVTANIRKFLQFQLTVNVVALIIAFLGAAVLDESPLTAIQLLYVNLIMDSLGSLALATEGPTADVLDAMPIHKSASLLTPSMIRNILLVAAYQLTVLLVMMFSSGNAFVGVPDFLDEEQKMTYRYTCIYNFFIYVQLINMFNSRRIKSELNIFKGLLKSSMFWLVIASTSLVQVLIMMLPGISDVFKVFNCGSTAIKKCKLPEGKEIGRISSVSWIITIGLALGAFVVHFLGRLVHMKGEFAVTEKRIAKDMKRIKKREEDKIKQKVKEEAKAKKSGK